MPTLIYGPRPLNQVDVTEPTAGGNAPTCLLIHGGKWKGGDRNSGKIADTETFLTRNGWRAASLDFTMLPSETFPGILADIRLCMEYLTAHLGQTHTRWASWGYSSGGHLGAWLAIEGLVDKHVDVSGPTQLDLLTHIPEVVQLCATSGCDAASPNKNVGADMAPILYWRGTSDATIPAVHGTLLRDAMTGVGAECIYKEFVGGHATENISDAEWKKIKQFTLPWLNAA